MFHAIVIIGLIIVACSMILLSTHRLFAGNSDTKEKRNDFIAMLLIGILILVSCVCQWLHIMPAWVTILFAGIFVGFGFYGYRHDKRKKTFMIMLLVGCVGFIFLGVQLSLLYLRHIGKL